MKLLVTGATGFLGSTLLPLLRAATEGMARSAAHREVTRLVREAVEALRDRRPPPHVDVRRRTLEARR